MDRPRAESDPEGFIKVVHKGREVLGVTLVAARAGESLHEWIQLLEGHLSVQDLATTIRVYPTYSRINLWAAGRLLEQRLRGGVMGDLIATLSKVALRWMRFRQGF